MHIFVPAFWNAPRGGLHEHLVAQARAILQAGHRCTILCRPGEVADRLAALGAEVVQSSFEDLAAEARALEGRDFDMVHAHPGDARALGLEVARSRSIPFLLTLHGTRLDSLRSYRDEVSVVIAVSNAIRDFVVTSGAIPAERVITIPNGIDTEIFSPADAPAQPGSGSRIALATRFDRDKSFVADVLQETWRGQTDRGRAWEWTIAGEGSVGSSLPALEQLAAAMTSAGARVRFSGWNDQHGLADVFKASDVAIAAGRAAAEAMACGIPTIAIGSRGYLGPMDEQRAWHGLYGNFGGLGDQHEGYPAGAMLEDLEHLLDDGQARARIGRFSAVFVRALLAQPVVDRALLGVYEAIGASTGLDRAWPHAAPVAPSPVWSRIDALQAEARELRSQLKLLEQREQRAADRASKLERRLASMEASRWWKLRSLVRRPKVRSRR